MDSWTRKRRKIILGNKKVDLNVLQGIVILLQPNFTKLFICVVYSYKSSIVTLLLFTVVSFITTTIILTILIYIKSFKNIK